VPFRTSQVERREVILLVVELEQEGAHGRGESFVHETFGTSMEAELRIARTVDLDGGDGPASIRGRLQALPASPARDALDQALWDLEARQRGMRVWELLGRSPPGPVETMFTIGLDRLGGMEASARRHRDWPLLKVKVDAEQALARVDAIRRGAPGCALLVDANQSWSVGDYERLAPAMAARGVVLLEQPLPPEEDAALAELPRPVPVCADESFGSAADLARLAERYDVVSLKLARLGGLTAALAAERSARELGLRVMVGCMVSTSLAIAPAFVLARAAEFVDLDGPLHLASDRPDGLRYEGATVFPPDPTLWG
jgi:L-alanine-DL-glutamate epimerase-like enolase superfamily enzyme